MITADPLTRSVSFIPGTTTAVFAAEKYLQDLEEGHDGGAESHPETRETQAV